MAKFEPIILHYLSSEKLYSVKNGSYEHLRCLLSNYKPVTITECKIVFEDKKDS
jgi:hypothetical protein